MDPVFVFFETVSGQVLFLTFCLTASLPLYCIRTITTYIRPDNVMAALSKGTVNVEKFNVEKYPLRSWFQLVVNDISVCRVVVYSLTL